MNGYQPLALSFAEELSDLKRRYEKLERKHADLERHCRGLESKLSKTRDRMKLYRERCRAWESALGNANELYRTFLHGTDSMSIAKAFGVSVCMANIRKDVAPTYPSADCVELRTKILKRTSSPEVDKTE
ncbi:Uncharacterised protein [Collinsella aerofaciens]|uniref:Uncharacterized protein n=1 Tax=Collinsella aerofaciens TaxID=74426 RepID=A0A5K1JFF6_9ACTN|nr:hypothetical protein [Collinsella aerofaciens]VWM03921.1 Uncharacterised protein [Collinsella aerofaciens]